MPRVSEQAEVLRNILERGTRTSLTSEHVDLMVARQVSSSLRLDGIDFSVEQALAVLQRRDQEPCEGSS